MELQVHKLSPFLFWDVAQASVNWDAHNVWLTERILTRGTWEDWQLLTQSISAKELRNIAPKLKVAPREQTFLNKWLDKYDPPQRS
jgi:hypothetical protein